MAGRRQEKKDGRSVIQWWPQPTKVPGEEGQRSNSFWRNIAPQMSSGTQPNHGQSGFHPSPPLPWFTVPFHHWFSKRAHVVPRSQVELTPQTPDQSHMHIQLRSFPRHRLKLLSNPPCQPLPPDGPPPSTSPMVGDHSPKVLWAGRFCDFPSLPALNIKDIANILYMTRKESYDVCSNGIRHRPN